MSKFNKGDLIVYLGQDKLGKETYNHDIPINYIFQYIGLQTGSGPYILGKWLNGNEYSGPPEKDFRLATEEEVIEFKRVKKPFDVVEFAKNKELHYEVY